MQVNPGFNELRLVNDQPVLLPPRAPRQPNRSTAPPFIDNRSTPQPVSPGQPNLQRPSFENLLLNVRGTLPPTIKPPVVGPSPLGEPPHVGQLATRVRDYRNTLNAVNTDLIVQLKSARDTLQEARKSGDQDGISGAEKAIDNLNVELKANRDSLSLVQGDVKDLRELSQQLIADVKAGNLDSIQQDRNAVTLQRDKVLADLQA
jgi:hypothetical protein